MRESDVRSTGSEIDGRSGNGEDLKRSGSNRGPNDGSPNRTRDGKQSLSSSIGEMANKGVEKTEEAISSVGGKISSFGDSIKETMSESGALGTAATALGDGLKNSGEYLRSHGFEAMSKDLTEVIRRHPVPAVWISLGAGFLVGRAVMRR